MLICLFLLKIKLLGSNYFWRVMNKVYPVFYLCLILSVSKAQQYTLLNDESHYEAPLWKESLHYIVDKNKDTLTLSVGSRVDDYLLQQDHYKADGYWQGVDRFVWEGEDQLRVYHYDGAEDLVLFENGQIQEWMSKKPTAAPRSIAYHYTGGLLKRVSTQTGNDLNEEVYLYRVGDSALQKVKYFSNGDLESEVRFTYCSNGKLQKEELWSDGEIQKIATHSYENQILQRSSVLNIQNAHNQLESVCQYQFLDDGTSQTSIQYYSLTETKVEKESLCTFDSKGRLISKELRYWDHEEILKEVFLFSFPERETEDFEVLNLNADSR